MTSSSLMIPGAPREARWVRPEPRRALPAAELERAAGMAFPGRRVVAADPFAEGLRNANFKIRLDAAPEWVVLRIYEHDASLCRKEIDLLNVAGRLVPVPEVLYAEPDGSNGIPPFVFLSYIDGVAFRELKRRGDAESIAQAAFDAGRILALAGRISFQKSGWLGPGPEVTGPLMEGANPGPRFVDLCLSSATARQRVHTKLRDQVSALIWSYAGKLSALESEARLVHGDFGGRNLLVRHTGSAWTVAAVLDWEFAVAGSPLADIGHFLRYESASCPKVEPHFSNGYRDAGGSLPEAWRRLARVLDLLALCGALTHDALPDPVPFELVELLSATVEDRDPRNLPIDTRSVSRREPEK